MKATFTETTVTISEADFAHSNLYVRIGPLKYLVNSPEMNRRRPIWVAPEYEPVLQIAPPG